MNGLEPQQFDCVIWGGYARGNTGDEWCLAATLERLRPRFGRSMAVLSSHPEYTRWLFPEATVVPYVAPRPRRLKRWRRFLRGCGLVPAASNEKHLLPDWDWLPEMDWTRCLTDARGLYLAGGGYLTDLFPMDQILPPIELAWRLKLPVSTAPIGIGPFQSAGWAERVASILRNADLKVRDQLSLDFCRARGLNAALDPDDAFLQVREALPIQTQDDNAKHSRKIGVCVFRQYGQDAGIDLSDWWVACLRGLAAQHPDHTIEGFCFHTALHEDFREMVRLFLRAGLPLRQVLTPIPDFRQATNLIRDYDLVIATRFHAIVAANVFQIPNLAVASGDYYSAKMSAAVLEHAASSRLVNPSNAAPASVLALCRNALNC